MVDLGVGTSSFTGGRPIPALALGIEVAGYGVLFRGAGVQTTIYAQNSWTFAAYKQVYREQSGMLAASLGAGLGGAYIVRSYKRSLDSEAQNTYENVIGPHFSAKFEVGVIYLGFDTVLGLTKKILQHVALNFQDMSHVTLGFTF